MAIVKYRSPDAVEREVLFAWLKQASSWTAWSYLFQKHKVFSAAVERAFNDDKRHPQPDGRQLIPDQWMSSVFAHEASFEAGLDRLRDGNRRCFLFLGAKGHFSDGTMEPGWWEEMNGREQYGGGARFSPNESPLWPEIKAAIDEFLDVLSNIAAVLQPRHTDVPAPMEDLDAMPPAAWAKLASRVPSDPALRRVPTPPDPQVYVKTKHVITEYGIWEPVDSKGGDVDGPMNYLHGGHPAPTIGFANDGQREEGRPTLWHLIWVDNRYGTKPIPAEERTYQFGMK
jgi:hypothetical protein